VEPAGFTKVSALGIEEQRVRTILKLKNGGANADQLGHDFRVFVKIRTYEAPNALRVPISALFRRRDQWTVYAVERGRARAVPVKVGQRNTAFAEVLGGLAEGAVVVMHPSDRVADGVRVSPTNEDR
jgi:HlyD family secretion protein